MGIKNVPVRLGLTLALCGLAACTFDTRYEAAPPSKRLRYRVDITRDWNGNPQCSVYVDMVRWPSHEPVVFELPPYYQHNPAMPVPGLDPTAVQGRDAYGHLLAYAPVSQPFSPGGGTWISFPEETKSLAYSIDLDPRDPTRFGPPMPRLKPGVQMLDGASLFILPSNGNSLETQWRNPIDLRLDWTVDAKFSLLGEAGVSLKSNYALMFYRGALLTSGIPANALEFTAGTHRVTLYTTGVGDDSVGLASLATDFQGWIPLLEARLLPLPWDHLYIGTDPVYAGLEGIGGYWFQPQSARSAEVHLHELTHTFVGVLQGEYDEAWWKEGVTNYFGKVLAAQAGYYAVDSSFQSALTQSYAAVPSVNQYALSDPDLRTLFYHPLDTNYIDQPPEDFYSLLYGKGGQAAMLLDVWLLEKSAGQHDLFEVVRILFQTGSTAFDRRELASVLQGLAGQSADSLLTDVCDRAGPFDPARLQSAFSALVTWHRFDPPSGFSTAALPRKSPGHYPEGFPQHQKF